MTKYNESGELTFRPFEGKLKQFFVQIDRKEAKHLRQECAHGKLAVQPGSPELKAGGRAVFSRHSAHCSALR
jgi:hypothetical protein